VESSLPLSLNLNLSLSLSLSLTHTPTHPHFALCLSAAGMSNEYIHIYSNFEGIAYRSTLEGDAPVFPSAGIMQILRQTSSVDATIHYIRSGRVGGRSWWRISDVAVVLVLWLNLKKEERKKTQTQTVGWGSEVNKMGEFVYPYPPAPVHSSHSPEYYY